MRDGAHRVRHVVDDAGAVDDANQVLENGEGTGGRPWGGPPEGRYGGGPGALAGQKGTDG